MSTDKQNAPMDFSGLVLGFSSAALYYLGESTVEGQKVENVNAELARQNIEILQLLENKTINNLTEDESKLLAQVLSDLNKKLESLK